MNDAWRRSLAAELGATIEQATAVSGGDINDAYRVVLSDARVVFLKTNARASMFRAERDGLAWLAETSALRIPAVLAFDDHWIALEWIEPGMPSTDHDERLGVGLATLHLCSAKGFGFATPNFIGSLPQDNTEEPDWPSFLLHRRLEPQLAMAVDQQRASDAMRRGFTRLFSAIEQRVGPPEPPARLHGDLWSGNHHVASDGQPVLIDPAVYAGHREMDLAMMRLFGGFSERVFDAYAEAYPLSSGWRQRVALYQLYPLMVHVNLFGGSYVTSVERALSAV